MLGSVWRMLIGASMDSLVRLEGAESDDIAISSDRLLMTMFRWHGARSLQSASDLRDTARLLRDRLAPALARPGHALQIGFLRDPRQAETEIGRSIAEQEVSAARMHLDVSAIMRERRARLPAALTGESMWIAVWSSPALAGTDLKREMAEASALFRGLPPVASGQVPGKVARTVLLRHRTLVGSLAADFAAAGQVLEKLPVAAAVRVARGMLGSRDLGEADAWTPRMPLGDDPDGQLDAMTIRSGILRFPETPSAIARADGSGAAIQTLAEQILDERWQVTSGNAVRVGNRSFAGFDLALAPETLVDFGRLVELARHPLAERPLRWRCCWLIEAGGMAGHALRIFLLSVFTFLARTHNARIRDAFADLRHLDDADDQVVRLRASFAVWEDGLAEDEAGRNLLDRQLGRLRRAVESWGNARTDRLFGDPCAGLVSSVPGAACASTAPSSAAPLLHAVALLPLDRPASPWTSGPLVLSSPDGRIWPWSPGSPMQVSWCDLMVGTPGSGKSSLLSAMNLASVLAPSSSARTGAARLPRIGIIDIGHSSQGLVALLRDGLPAHRRHEAVHARLANTAEAAINPCDTPPGCRHPPPALMSWLVNFVGLLVLPDDGRQPDGMAGLIQESVKEAYRQAADGQQAQRWAAAVSPQVDAALAERGIRTDHATTWWECADALAEAGDHATAAIAQRMAVPRLASLVGASRAPHIETMYGKVVAPTGETLPERFARGIQSAVGQWPIVANPTRFSTGEARVVALDLAEVTSSGATVAERRASALMYMLARQAICGHWWTDHEELAGDPRLPKAWQRRHRQLHAESAGEPKRLCIDEFHRTGCLEGIRAQVELDIRESRKHGIQLALASQRIDDFDASILDMATGVWVCSADAATVARERLGLSERAARIIRDRLHGPTADGAPVFAALKLRDGPCQQLLVNRMGPIELWAFSTTAEDVALRERLAAMLSPERARALLAAAFPTGTARGRLDEMKAARTESEAADPVDGIIQALADQLVARQGEILPATEQ